MVFNLNFAGQTATLGCRIFLCVLIVAMFWNISPAQADTTDDLVLALMNKGVLTEEEGAPLLKNQSLSQPKAKVKSEVTASYADGITFQTADQANLIALNGRVQLDSRYYSGKDAQNIDTLDIRRAYLTLRGKIHKDYDFNVTADFTQQSNQLDQAYFGVNWFDFAKLRIGQFDMPFGLEHLTSDLYFEFQERSFNDYLTPGKERGVMLHGAPVKGVYYGLAASTGRGKNVANQDSQVESLDMIARVSANLAEVFDSSNAVYHVGVDYSNGDVSANQATGSSQLTAGGFTAPSLSTEGRGIKFFTPGKFSNALTDNEVERTRYGMEGAYARGDFKLQSEWFKQRYSGVNNANTTFDKDLSTWYVSAYWMLTGESLAATYQPNGTWGRVTPKHDFSPADFGSGAIGAWGLGLRYSEFDASDFAVGSGPGEIVLGASTTRAKSWTAGLRWVLNTHTHLVANYVFTEFSEPLDVKNAAGVKLGVTNQEKALTVRAQIDF